MDRLSDRGSIPLRSTKKDVERRFRYLFFISLRKSPAYDKVVELRLENVYF